MELHQIRYFLAVHEAANFTRAAERCAVSQPALTAAIKRLEGELGGPLFVRDRAGARLTPLGELMLPSFRRIAGDLEAATHAAERHRLLEGAQLRAGALETLGPRRLARLIAALARIAPGVDVEVPTMACADLLKRLEEGALEIGVGVVPEPPPPWLVARPLYTERYVVLLPPGHPLAEREALELRDLDGEAYVDRLSCELREAVLAECEGRGARLYAAYRSPNEAWIEHLVLAGVGLALMPEFSVTSPEAVVRPLREPALSRRVCLLRCVDHPMSPAARAFWSLAADASA